MHEASLVDALFDQVDAAMPAHPGGRVRLLRVRIGELAGVEPELFRIAFEVLRVERGRDGATLEIAHEEAAWSCATCAASVPRGSILRCAVCNGGAALVAGGDIVLDRIELEVPDV